MATLTAAEGGSTIDVRVNADIRVTLTADPGTTWTAPGVDGGTILKAVSSSVSAAGAIAEFRALQPGTARLSATENPTCLPLCGRPSRLWEVTVTVTPHPVP